MTAYLGHEDPGITLERQYGSEGVNNPSETAPDRLDELLAAGAAETAFDERAPHYQVALALIMEDALAVPLYTNAGVVAHVPEVKGVSSAGTRPARRRTTSPWGSTSSRSDPLSSSSHRWTRPQHGAGPLRHETCMHDRRSRAWSV